MNIRLLPKNHLKNLDIIHVSVYNIGEGLMIKSAVCSRQTAFIGLWIHDNVLNEGVRLPNNLPERVVVEIWQQLMDRAGLTTAGGEPIRIIYPGRKNDGRGADFRDAVIDTSQGIIKGDIEVHVKSSDWQAHRHHQDPAYNRVILHVVMWHNRQAATKLHNGKTAPILALDKYLESPSNHGVGLVHSPASSGMPCLRTAKGLASHTLAEFLDSAGERRFSAKAAQFQAELSQTEASQCLYQGIMGALGYVKNKPPMLKLARRLPLQILQSMAQGEVSDGERLARLQALLLGTAGLLPSQRYDRHRESQDDEWADKLEGLWASSNGTKVLSEDDWHLFKVRPNNFPLRRIAAMSYLILRYRERGLVEQVVDMIKEAPVSGGYLRLEKGLGVTAHGYWASHFDFGLNCRTNNPTLLGRWRAADIAVNVLLPFALAWGKLDSQPEVKEKTFELYRGYPRLAANTVERHMIKQLGLNNSLVNSAQRQQGLIHI